MRSRRNRKLKVQRVAYMPTAVVVLLILGVSLSVGYVWLCIRCESLGNEIKTLENRHRELSKKYQEESYKWSFMKSPRNVLQTLAQRGIVMNWPAPHQVRRMNRQDLYADSWDEASSVARQLADARRALQHE